MNCFLVLVFGVLICDFFFLLWYLLYFLYLSWMIYAVSYVFINFQNGLYVFSDLAFIFFVYFSHNFCLNKYFFVFVF